MKNFLFLSILSIACFTSCKKTIAPSETEHSVKSRMTADLLAQLVDIEADFHINVSSSVGSNVNGSSTIGDGVTVVEAYSREEANVGNLTVNGSKQIPFLSRNYFYQIDSTETPSIFTGRTNSYSLSGGGFPEFAIENYSTSLAAVSFEGLTQEYTLPTSSSLTVNWTVDNGFPNDGKAALIVASESDAGEHTTLYKEVNQSLGQATLSASELSQFDNAGYIRVYFARGSGHVSQISGKTVAIENLAYTYSRIYR